MLQIVFLINNPAALLTNQGSKSPSEPPLTSSSSQDIQQQGIDGPMKWPRYQQIRKVPGQPHPTAVSAASSGQQPFHGDIFINGRPMQSMTADLDIGPLLGRCTRQPGKQASGLSPTPPEAPAPAGPPQPRGARGGLR